MSERKAGLPYLIDTGAIALGYSVALTIDYQFVREFETEEEVEAFVAEANGTDIETLRRETADRARKLAGGWKTRETIPSTSREPSNEGRRRAVRGRDQRRKRPQDVSRADIFLCVGTSLQVYPASQGVPELVASLLSEAFG